MTLPVIRLASTASEHTAEEEVEQCASERGKEFTALFRAIYQTVNK